MAYEITVLTTMAISILFALSLNVITGFCGQVSLGHAAFYGIGAYTAALLTKSGIPLALALLPAAAAAGAVGFVVGMASLRVRDDFLAITTMGVAFLFVGFVRKQEMLGGEIGISGIPSVAFGRPGLLALSLLCTALFVLLTVHIRRSWMGFAFDSVADDEDTARILGIDVPRFKLWAFVIGTAGAGVAGGLYAHHIRFIGPDSFGFLESITALVMVIVGGIGSIWGVALVAAILSVLPLFLQFVDDYKLLLYGVLVFATVRYAPGGVAGLARTLAMRIRR
ncbi:MAG: branched-chain amino acid ABC transporter permease [Gammaproteobacteria bacterium]|nr:branched-chain amino acid ABC transporter permease [Gammaproteobacteria bacterium]MYG66699.1 branched-chain amino acid ABC transporter permease [Gammaproteobacteria bacterium]